MRLPFAAYQVARFAVDLPIELKIQPKKGEQRKLLLRNVARNLGLPQAIVDRPKKAVQYSTGVSKSLRKIARQKHRALKEYLQETFQAAVKKVMQTQ
jgi:asparagine synthase (glutamine-hydrolysing)